MQPLQLELISAPVKTFLPDVFGGPEMRVEVYRTTHDGTCIVQEQAECGSGTLFVLENSTYCTET